MSKRSESVFVKRAEFVQKLMDIMTKYKSKPTLLKTKLDFEIETFGIEYSLNPPLYVEDCGSHVIIHNLEYALKPTNCEIRQFAEMEDSVVSEPEPKCPRHINVENEHPCPACMRKVWDAETRKIYHSKARAQQQEEEAEWIDQF